MATFDHANLNRATDLLFAHKQRLESAAQTALRDFQVEPSEVFTVCAEYDSQWSELVDQFVPAASVEARTIRQAGLIPIFITSSTFEDFLIFQLAGITLPKDELRSDQAWFLLLHEVGHTWAQLPITKTPKLDS
jgi:hypothetical protein